MSSDPAEDVRIINETLKLYGQLDDDFGRSIFETMGRLINSKIVSIQEVRQLLVSTQQLMVENGFYMHVNGKTIARLLIPFIAKCQTREDLNTAFTLLRDTTFVGIEKPKPKPKPQPKEEEKSSKEEDRRIHFTDIQSLLYNAFPANPRPHIAKRRDELMDWLEDHPDFPKSTAMDWYMMIKKSNFDMSVARHYDKEMERIKNAGK